MNEYVIVNAFLNYLKFEKHYSEHTISSYAADLRQFADFVVSNSDTEYNEQTNYIHQDGNTSVSLLVQTKSHIEQLLLTVDSDLARKYLILLGVNQFSKATVSRKFSCLRSFYKFLKKQNSIALNPIDSVRAPMQIKKLPKTLEYEQIQSLLQMPEMNNWLGARDRAILETLYSTGIRLSELVALNMNNIDFSAEVVHIQTNGKKERVLSLSCSSLQAINFYIELRNKKAQNKRFLQMRLSSLSTIQFYRNKKMLNDNVYNSEVLFVNQSGGRLSGRSVRRNMDKYLEMAGLDRSVSPRTLRHSFAIHMLEKGIKPRKLQELLGHQTHSTTRVYSYMTKENHNNHYEDNLEISPMENEIILLNAS